MLTRLWRILLVSSLIGSEKWASAALKYHKQTVHQLFAHREVDMEKSVSPLPFFAAWFDRCYLCSSSNWSGSGEMLRAPPAEHPFVYAMGRHRLQRIAVVLCVVAIPYENSLYRSPKRNLHNCILDLQ